MILISTNHPHLRFPSQDVIRILRLVFRKEEKELPKVAIVFTYNRFIKKINKAFLKHDFKTDVLAFELGKDGGIEAEIYINLDAARNQANEYRVKYTKEVQRLLIHAALHLSGYKDKTVKEKKEMLKKENMYLKITDRKS